MIAVDDQYHVDVGKTGEKLKNIMLYSDSHNDVFERQPSTRTLLTLPALCPRRRLLTLQVVMRPELPDLNIPRTLVKRAFLWRKEEKADS